MSYFYKDDSIFHLSHFILSIILGVLKSNPLLLPGRHAMNMGMLASNIGAYGYFMMDNAYASGLSMLGITTTLSSAMGVTLTMAIGGNFTIMFCDQVS